MAGGAVSDSGAGRLARARGLGSRRDDVVMTSVMMSLMTRVMTSLMTRLMTSVMARATQSDISQSTQGHMSPSILVYEDKTRPESYINKYTSIRRQNVKCGGAMAGGAVSHSGAGRLARARGRGSGRDDVRRPPPLLQPHRAGRARRDPAHAGPSSSALLLSKPSVVKHNP